MSVTGGLGGRGGSPGTRRSPEKVARAAHARELGAVIVIGPPGAIAATTPLPVTVATVASLVCQVMVPCGEGSGRARGG
ncbi:MAG: hypothetical protein IPO52_11805 [Gemmatimonadetes bacterium]|nr:hypothetical protein [Gemmatimonadota bacterium]